MGSSGTNRVTSSHEFYDSLAPLYHLVYEDWSASIDRQARALDSIFHPFFGDRVRSVLDVACGIGTQSIGLAALGYSVTASDISSAAIERAKVEATSRGLDFPISVADMRFASAHHPRAFDIVLCADNSLPHLLSEEAISEALGEFFRCTKPGGLCAISVRDYASVERGGAQVKPYGIRREGPLRWVLLQVWDWRDELYDLSLYFLRDTGNGTCDTRVMRTTYFAIGIPQLMGLMNAAGFVDVRRIDEVFFQPVLVGVRPIASAVNLSP